MELKLAASTNIVETPPPPSPPEPVVIKKAAVATQQDQQGIVLGSLTPPKEPKDEIKEEMEFPPTAKYPPQCTPSQFESLAQQLPPEQCVENAKKPWNKSCSFQDETVCGNANPHWLYDFVRASSTNSFRGIIVGCNKGVDALQILTKISATNTYNIEKWDKQFGKIPETAKLDSNYECRDPSPETKTPGTVQDVRLYCIDGAPNTVKQLQSTKQALGYNDELEIVHSIISDQHFSGGLFVKTIDPIGFMGSGTKYWRGQCLKKPEECETAPATNIDTLVKSTPALKNQPFLQYLKVSAVGSDYFILKGAAKTLERTQYIDFGYHWNFDWGDTELKDLIYRLKKKGFVCYFAGTLGETLWRITDCWQDHYALKFPASIGCVNANIPEAEPLLDRMEELFHKTLEQATQS